MDDLMARVSAVIAARTPNPDPVSVAALAEAVVAEVLRPASRAKDPAALDRAEAEVRAGVSVAAVRRRYGLSGSVVQRLTRVARGE